jgi:hydrogenase maturation protease
MATEPRPRSLVIGVGNPDRGDDGAGRAAARWLLNHPPAGVDIIEHDGEVSSLLASLDGAATTYLIDACTSGAAAGTVQRFDAGAAPLPQDAFSLSTHGLSLAEAIELARTLGRLPDRCIVYAIEGDTFEPGASLSPPVKAAIADVGERVRQELSRTKAPEEPADA